MPKTKMYVILHDRVGTFDKGTVVPADELGDAANIQRLIDLGAIARSRDSVPDEPESLLDKVSETFEAVLPKVKPEPEPVKMVESPKETPNKEPEKPVKPAEVWTPPPPRRDTH